MKPWFAPVFATVSLAAGTAGATDCKISPSHPNKAWQASCGLSQTDHAWKGYVQGSLSGAKLEFQGGGAKKTTLDGGVLAGLSITKIEEIPICSAVAPDTESKVPAEKAHIELCKKVAAAIGLEVPFLLKGYSQEPTAFALGSAWDKKTKGIKAGKELKVPVCDPKAEANPKETDAIAEFRKTMECRWVPIKPPMFSAAGGGNMNPSYPEFRPEQGYLPGSETEAPDLYATVAVACPGKGPSGSTKVCSGRIVCEDRSRRRFPAERDPKKRAVQFAEAMKAAGLPSLEEFEAAKKKTDAQEQPDRMDFDVKSTRKAIVATLPKDADGAPYLPETFQRNFLPRLKLKDEGKEKSAGYVEGLNVFPNGNYGADILGGDVRRYSTQKDPDLTKLYDLMRIPKVAQALSRIPIGDAKGKTCLKDALDASATKEQREYVAKLDRGIRNGGGFGQNQACLQIAEVGRARTYIAKRMDFEAINYSAKNQDLWSGSNSIKTAATDAVTETHGLSIDVLQSLNPSYLAKDDQFIDYEAAEWMIGNSAFVKDEQAPPLWVKQNRSELAKTRRSISEQLVLDNRVNFAKTDKALVTDAMEATCLPPDGKACTPENVDPIACFADTRIGRLTQADLKAGTIVPGGTTPDKKVQDAAKVFKAH